MKKKSNTSDGFTPTVSIHPDGFSFKLEENKKTKTFHYKNYKELVIHGDFKTETIDLVLAGSGVEEKNIVFFFSNAVVFTSTYTDVTEDPPAEKRYIIKSILFPNKNYRVVISDSKISEVQ